HGGLTIVDVDKRPQGAREKACHLGGSGHETKRGTLVRMSDRGALARLDGIARQVQRGVSEERRVLSFHEYLELVAADPLRQTRDAARYLRDCFDHFGRVTLKRPWGDITRFRLFDLPWLDAPAARRSALVAQERVQ